MTDINQTPEPNPAETPTTPLPTTPEAAPVPDAVPLTDPAAPPYAQQTAPAQDAQVRHHVSENAVALMVIGSLLFAMLAFGVGWTARGVATRFQAQHAGAMMGTRGPVQSFGGVQGRQGGAMMRGDGPCAGQRGGQGTSQGQGWGQGQSQDQGQSWDNGSQLPPGHPDITQ